MKKPSQRLQLLKRIDAELEHQSEQRVKLDGIERIERAIQVAKRRYINAIDASIRTLQEMELGVRLLLGGAPHAHT